MSFPLQMSAERTTPRVENTRQTHAAGEEER